MKHLYNNSTVLQTESKVFLEANYNRVIHNMTKTGDVIYYKAPEDPSAHPMYVDAGGRNVPVDPETLQPMTNEAGNLVDKNGVLLPRDDITNILPHKDDVRIAVTSAEFDVKDEEGNDILISPDGDIIPTDDNGVPGTVLVEGVPWAVDEDGNPVAPLDRIYPLHSYVRPVRAENVPVTSSGALAPKVEDLYPEYFDISHIVKAERPSKRGVLVAWASESDSDSPIMAGTSGYKNARFYVASEEFPYKYWTAPETADPVGVLSGDNITTFDATWTVAGGTGVFRSTNLISADFSSTRYTSNSDYFQKVLNLDTDRGHNASFTVMAQNSAQIIVELHEWSDTQANPNDSKSGSYLRKTVLSTTTAPAGVAVDVNVDITPSAGSVTQVMRVVVKRMNYVSQPKVTLTNMTFKAVSFPIAGVGPRAVYDRPVQANKIVIGVDYSLDEIASRESHANKPSDYAVRIYRDRGDGLFVWETVSENPHIDESGHITLNFDGTSWGESESLDEVMTIMGVQLAVFGMKRKDARVNIMEISARRRYDVSDMLASYNYESNVSDDSFVLPFGTVNSNNGSLYLSNHDGHFNPNNQYLLNRGGTAADGSDTFTDVPNPFYQILNGKVDIEINTATFEPGDTERDFVRMVTARSTDRIDAGSSMTAGIDFTDDSEILQRTEAPRVFYAGETMSIIQVLYMLLDSIGFTSVKFANEDEHFATHLKYFWTKPDSDNVWSVIEEVCRSTQTVAFFDEYNVLNFKSLKGMYEDALANQPAQVLTTEDLPGVKANISNMELDEKVSANKVTINYRETTEPEKTPSGVAPMAVVWEPEGTQVIRADYLRSDLNDIQVGNSGASPWLNIPSESAKTWPYEGMVNCEGEYIKYGGKEYFWHRADGTTRRKILMNEDERKERDKENEFLSHKNTWTGKLRIRERGAEGTTIKSHTRGVLGDFTRRYRQGSTVVDNYNKGISIKNSRLFMVAQDGVNSLGTISVTHGSSRDSRPSHLGTQLRINAGQNAGICFGMTSPSEDGIFVELTTTEGSEAQGRPRGELHVFVRKNGAIKFYGFGVDVPVSKYRDYAIDVSVKNGSHKTSTTDYSRFYAISLQSGNRGDNVRFLQTALNEHQERLVVDGVFGRLTKEAVIRLQRRKGLTRDGIVNEEEWKAMETGAYDGNFLSIHATVDGNYSLTTIINKAELPTGWDGGRFGAFTRGKTSASFEYIYAMRGREDIEFDDSMFFDYVQGGYVSDQLDAGWIYSTKRRWVSSGGKRYQVTAISNQLFMHDFGPYIHEMREYDVEFKDEEPALSSFPYLSNTNQVHLTGYLHRPFSARVNLVNKSRHDAVLNGDDTITYGSENSISQKFMVYGTVLKINDERSVTVSDKSSVDARGVDELSIDVDWIQSEESANKLGSHIVEAMSNPVSTYDVDIFGNASIKVGQVVSVYNPQHGIGDKDSLESMNRFFVYGVSQNNSGSHGTSLKVREVIGGSGLRNIRLRDVLARNNNAMNTNPDIEEVRFDIDRRWVPAGYDFRGGVNARYVSAIGSGGGGVRLAGTSDTPYQTAMLLNPYPDGVGRFDYPYGEHYLFTVNVTGNTRVAASIVVEGWPTTGSMTKAISSKIVHLEPGETKDITMIGQFLTDSDIPEMELSVRVLNPDNHGQGASSAQSITVNSAYFRSSQNVDDIYPLHGGGKFRKS